MEEVKQFELNKEFLERLQGFVESKDEPSIQSMLSDLPHQDVALVLEDFDAEHSKYVLDLLPNDLSAQVINGLDPDTRTKFLKFYSRSEIAKYIEFLDSDDAADILNEQPFVERKEIISILKDEEQKAHILDLIRYDEDVAGGLMAKELIKANLNWSVDQCIEEIRRQAEKVSKIYSVYVVDNNDLLLGRVSVKRLLLSPSEQRVAEVYEEDTTSVDAYTDEEEVANVMALYDLDAIPVVNFQGKLLGRITHDDIIDVITEAAEEDMQAMSGISHDVEEDDSIWKLTRARLPWLVIGLVGGVLGASFIEVFEDDLTKVTAIAFFIPLITATGGNVGIQSSTIVVQSLASPAFIRETNFSRGLKAVIVALINGVILALLILAFIYLTSNELRLALVVSTALFSVVLLASFFGTMIPVVLDKMKINPAYASGPFITTINDLLGLGVYFIVAHLLYQL